MHLIFLILCYAITEHLIVPQKKLEETEHTLFDLEERHRQANATIKEKEYLISNLLKSGELFFFFHLVYEQS